MISQYNVVAWILENEIKNEKGDPIDFFEHSFLIDIYNDQSQNLVVMKAAQIGLSTCEILKNFHDAKFNKMDIIYTLPTDSDVNVFVGGKVNRIIANNPILLEYAKDKDSIEQKQVDKSMIYFRGTWTKKAAIMVTADRVVHDEKDSSKQDVVRDFQARTQHSKFRQTHIFSHPSVPGNGVDEEWQKSDQKEWFIKCPHCQHIQYLSWDIENPRHMSIDIEKREFVCKKCRGILRRQDRAVGKWVARKKDAQWSGYHVSLLMAPWVTAGEIIDKFNDQKQTIDFFFNKVLGLPYAGIGNTVTEETILGGVREEENDYEGNLIMGVDTGVKLRYVIGNKQGLLGFGEMQSYEPDKKLNIPLKQSLKYFLIKFPNLIMVIDQGGDIIGSRKLAKKYPGRVFLCHYRQDRKTTELVVWGKGKEASNVLVDRNRMMQLVIDERVEDRWGLYNGTREDWYPYWLHWSHIYRIKEEDTLGIERYRWLRSDRDDWVHATIYWRVGLEKFGSEGKIVGNISERQENSYFINPDNTIQFNPEELFHFDHGSEEDDWR